MGNGPTVAVWLATIAVFGGAVLVGGPSIAEAAPATNQPEPYVDSVSLDRSTIETGETAVITAIVINEAPFSQFAPLTLEANGEFKNSATVGVPAESRRYWTFYEPFDEPGTYDITVNGVEAGELTVQPPPEAEFEVSDAELARSTITTGDRVAVTAEVENVGNAPGSAEPALWVDGEVVDERSVRLRAGQSATVRFSPRFDQSGSYDISVDDARAGTLTVQDPAEFELSEVTVSEREVLVGDSVSVTGTVSNTGDVEGVFDARLIVDGESVAEKPYSVEGGESGQIVFERTFDTPGTVDVAINDQRAGTVQMLAPANLSVTAATANTDEVLTGESVNVEATVANSGDVRGSKVIGFAVDGEEVDERRVSLGGGESTTVEFTRAFASAGDRRLTVGGESAGRVNVLAPASFEVRQAELNRTEVLRNESVEVSATVANTGDVEGTYAAELRVDGETVETESVSIGGAETATVVFDRAFGEAGEYPLAIGNVSAGRLTVLRPADLSVVDTELGTSSLRTGESAVVQAVVENIGDVRGETTVALRANDTVVEEEAVAVDGNAQRQVNLTYEFSEPGEKRLRVNEVDAGTVRVLAPARFDVRNVSLDREGLTVDEPLEVTGTVENTGDVQDTFLAQLLIEGRTASRTQVTLDGGESTAVSFEYRFDAAGRYDVEVSGSDGGTVTVDQPATFAITATNLSEQQVLQNESVRVLATVRNTGDRGGTYTAALHIDGQLRTQKQTAIPSGESETLTFAPRLRQAGAQEVTVGETTVGTVAVDRPARVGVANATVSPREVLPGDRIEISTTVRNDGDRAGELTVSVGTHRGTLTQRTIAIGPSEQRRLQFTEPLDTVGTHPVRVNNVTAGIVEVGDPPEFAVEEAAVPADWAASGEATRVRTVVRNPSNWAATRAVNVTVDEGVVATERVTLDPGERRELVIEFEATNGSVAVNGVEAGRLAASRESGDGGGNTGASSDGFDLLPVVLLVVAVGVAGVGWVLLSALGLASRD